jgi:hypothetical protein
MPSPRRHHEPAIAPAAGLAREALMDVLAGRAPAVDKRLLVVVARDGDRLLGDLGGDVHDATALARRLALAEARGTQGRLHDGLLRGGWLAIAGVDRIGRPDRQRMIATLLDVVADRGAAACITLAVPPAAAGLSPALETRLSAGLLVALPADAALATAGRGSLPDVIRTTARLHGLPGAQLVGHCRQRSVVRSRSIAMYVARVRTGLSHDIIGLAFGGRDHTTAMRSVKNVERRLRSDPSLAADVRDVLAALDHSPRRSRPA